MDKKYTFEAVSKSLISTLRHEDNYFDNMIKKYTTINYSDWNRLIIRNLNPDTQVQYPVEYASLDNNAVFAAARIINSLGFDFLNYEDIFKQDFLAAAGYVEHYIIDAEEYEKRGRADCSKKLFHRIENGTIEKAALEEAAEYNQRMVNELYPVIWSYCSRNIMNHATECTAVNQQSLQRVFNDNEYNNSLYKSIINYVDKYNYITISTSVILFAELNNKNIFAIDCIRLGKYHINTFTNSIKSICNLFEQLTISLVKDCCKLINQIKMNTAAGRDINYPVYDTAQALQQEAINEMAATVEPKLLKELSAEKLMPSFHKNPYIQDGKVYTDAEMDIVRYIVQDMIDAAKAV